MRVKKGGNMGASLVDPLLSGVGVVGVRGSSTTGLTVPKLSLESAVVGDWTARGLVLNAELKTNGLKGRFRSDDDWGNAAVGVMGLLRSCVHCFLLWISVCCC